MERYGDHADSILSEWDRRWRTLALRAFYRTVRTTSRLAGDRCGENPADPPDGHQPFPTLGEAQLSQNRAFDLVNLLVQSHDHGLGGALGERQVLVGNGLADRLDRVNFRDFGCHRFPFASRSLKTCPHFLVLPPLSLSKFRRTWQRNADAQPLSGVDDEATE